MKYRYLGNSGLKVSEISLGTMTFNGGKQSEIGSMEQPMANEITGMALDMGINLFDTADVYSKGVSETMLGKALGDRRKEAIIATKVRFAMSDKPNDTGLSRHHIIESCHDSLRRLNTDYIDLYQIHSYDPGTPLEETLRALDDLVKSGKVRYIGCSNLAAWQMMKALSISDKHDLSKFVSTQLYYSIGARDVEHELVPLSLEEKIGILCWSPLSGGFFTGKYRRDNLRPEQSRRSHRDASSMQYWAVDEEMSFDILDILEKISKDHHSTIAQVALSWLLHKPYVTSVIVGSRNIVQLSENLSASGLDLSQKEMDALDEAGKTRIPYPQSHQLTSDPR